MKKTILFLLSITSTLSTFEASANIQEYTSLSISSNSKQCQEKVKKAYSPTHIQREFSTQLRDQYLNKILKTYTSQYGNASFFSGQKLIEKNLLLSKAIENIFSECSNHAPEKIIAFYANLKSTNGERESSTEHFPLSLKSKYQDFIKRRLIIGIFEAKRIELALEDYHWSKEQKSKLQERLQRIKKVYPLIKSTSKFTYSLRSSIADSFYEYALVRQRYSHPDIDNILFPIITNGILSYQKIKKYPKKESMNPVQRVYNSLLFEKIPSNIELPFQNALSLSLRQSAQSIQHFCKMSFCELSQINSQQTTATLNQIDQQIKKATHKELCSCDIDTQKESFNANTILATAVLSIGGFVLCPFTFGIGCYIGGASSAALIGMSALNTAEAYSDNQHYSPVISVIENLPGLTEYEKAQTKELAKNSNRRLINGVINTAVSPIGVYSGLKTGYKIMTKTRSYTPMPASMASISSQEMVKATKQVEEQLKKMGTSASPSSSLTHAESAFRSNSYDIKYYPDKDGSYNLGINFKLDKLPPARRTGDYATNFMIHPEFSSKLKQLRSLGYDVVIDPTMKPFGAAAYFDEYQKIIAMQPNTQWHIFLHELQHLEFAHILIPKWSQVVNVSKKTGKSLFDILSPQQIAMLGEKRIIKVENMINKGHTQLAIEETLSVQAQLKEMGWHSFIPGGQGLHSIQYASNHIINELTQLPNLSRVQKIELYKAKAIVEATSPLPSTALVNEAIIGASSVVAKIVLMFAQGDLVLVQNPDYTWSSYTQED